MKTMSSEEIFVCTVGMCIVSYIPRVLPPFILAKVKLAPWIERWLNYVPTSVFGALVFSEIFLDGSQLNFNLTNISFLASIAVFIVAVKTKSLSKSILVGMAAFWMLENII